jgi:D-alanyl-D-alanine carboxypeptidase
MQSNAWRFGFVMSYPKDASPAKTCYRYEAWHYRYLGRDQAVAIHASGMSLREFLWAQNGGAGNDAAAQSSRITAPSALDQAAPAQVTARTAGPATARPAATGGTRSPNLDLASIVPPALTLIFATALLITFPVGELGEWRPRGRRPHARRSARRASLYPG